MKPLCYAVAFDVGQELVKVQLSQFYGIEINDFAVSVSRTALWIAKNQMLEETKDVVFDIEDYIKRKGKVKLNRNTVITRL